MKHINKIMLSIGFAFAVGGCAVGLTSNFVSASAKVGDTDTISTEKATSVTNGDYVVMGNGDHSKFVTSCGSDWLYLGVTKTDYVKYVVETTTGGFYLKDTDTNNYIYSSAAKKVTMSASSKSVFTLNTDGGLKVGSNYMSVNTNIRPYSALQSGGAAYLYEVSSASVSSIAIKTPPTKTNYKEGEIFDPTGLVLTVTYSDSTTADITSGFTCSPSEALSASDTTITVEYKGFATTLTIDIASITSLTYEGTLAKTSYNEGEAFDPTGLTVYAHYSSGEQVDVTSSVKWGSLVKDATSVTGSYGGQEITVSGLTVKAAAAFIKVTDLNQLEAGKQLLIVYENATSLVAAGEFTDKYYVSSEVSKLDDMIVPGAETSIFTLGGTAGEWTIKNSQGYLKFTGTSNGNMTVEDVEESSLTNNHKFKISFSSSEIRIDNVANSSRGLRYNGSATPARFTNYGSSSQSPIKLYAKSAGSVEDTITDISLSPSEDQIVNLGSTLTVVPTISGGADADMTVEWSLSNSGVVTLGNETTESGSTLVVTPTSVGEVTLTGTAVGDTSFKASIKITVVDPNTVTSISIENGAGATGICHINNTKTLSVNVLPESAVNKNVTWTSSDTSVATISTSGVVTSVKPGKTTITATSVLTSSVSDSIELIVYSQKGTKTTCPLSPIDINNSLEFGKWTFEVDPAADEEFNGFYFIKGIVAEEPDVRSGKYSFKMIDEWGGEIYISKLTSSSEISMTDEVMISVAYENISRVSGLDTVANATIEGTPSPASVEITGITLSGPSTVKVGNTITLNPTLIPLYTSQREINWSSSNTSIATVSGGVVTGVAEGTAVITATSAAKSTVKAEYTISVTSASSIAGKYTFVSNTTSYACPDGSSVTSYLNGFDTEVFQTVTSMNSDVRFGCAGGASDIFIGYEGAFSFGLSWTTMMDYTIAKVTFKGVRGDGAGGYVTSQYQGFDDVYSFAVGSTKEDFSFYPFSYMVAGYGAGVRNIYCEAIEVDVVANSDTTALSNYFNQSILDLTAKDCGELNVRTSTWEYINTSYDNLVYINEDAVTGVKNATANQSGTVAEQAAARYDYILAIYGTVNYANFLTRTITPVGGRLITKLGNNVYMTVLLVVSAIVVAAGVALVLIKKRKHSRN